MSNAAHDCSYDSANEKSHDATVNYSARLYRRKKYKEAADAAKKSIEEQQTAEGFHNLGCALRALGKNEEAVRALEEALKHNPDFVESHNEIAICYEQTGKYEKAIDHYQIATTFAPKTVDYWLNLSNARQQANRPLEALTATRFALSANKGYNDNIIKSFTNCFAQHQNYNTTPQLCAEISACLNAQITNPEKLAGIGQKIFLEKQLVKTLLSKPETALPALLEDKTLDWDILNTPLFTDMLQTLTVQNNNIEKLLTDLRKQALILVIDKTIEQKLWDKPYIFLSALACQCFINEYVFNETDEERKHIAILEGRLTESMKNESLNLYDLTLFGCYRPLHTLPEAEKIFTSTQNTPLKNLVKMQIAEPLQEKALKEKIPVITNIDDEISHAVKQQYEENPYPRWIRVEKTDGHTFDTVLKHLYPYMSDKDFSAINTQNPRTLIAGCGTGKQVIETALTFKNADILALDLSASSIAYAMRKTEEYGIKNVSYGLADILKLEEMDEQFDVIQCVGVLHHMDDPMAGWKILADRLKPGGFMLVALYSKTARRSLPSVYKLIEENNFETNIKGIRACREAVKTLPKGHEAKQSMQWIDFYATSTCRDLIFHVQERCYTTVEIEDALNALNMKFLGFHLPDPKIMNAYKEDFPDNPHGLDLKTWHDFEQQNPDTFKAMYNFWIQKH